MRAQAPAAVELAPAAKEAPTNAVYLELLGPSLLYAVNYEHRFWRIAVRAGLGYIPYKGGSVFSAPASVSYLAGDNSPYDAVEIGVSVAILHFSRGLDPLGLHGDLAIPLLIIGSRLQSRDGRFIFRAGLSPAITGSLLPIPYVAGGLTF